MLGCRARSASCTVQQRTLQLPQRPLSLCQLPVRIRRHAGVVKAESGGEPEIVWQASAS
jgi:hypothetical protein